MYKGPLAHVASQLMQGESIRVLNTIVMGSEGDNLIPKVTFLDKAFCQIYIYKSLGLYGNLSDAADV